MAEFKVHRRTTWGNNIYDKNPYAHVLLAEKQQRQEKRSSAHDDDDDGGGCRNTRAPMMMLSPPPHPPSSLATPCNTCVIRDLVVDVPICGWTICYLSNRAVAVVGRVRR